MHHSKAWIAAILAGILIAGCGGRASHPAKVHPYSGDKKPAKVSAQKTDISRNILVADSSGNYLPIPADLRFNSSDGRKLLRKGENGRCQSFQALDAHINRVLEKFEKSGKRNLLIFVHGGMTTIGESLERLEQQYPQIIGNPEDENDGYYPIFIIWRSGLMSSYWEQLCCIRGGKRTPGLGIPTIPLYLLKDLGIAVFSAPLAWIQQTHQFWTSISSFKDIIGIPVHRCDEAVDPSGFQDAKTGVFFCHKGNREKETRILHDTFNLIMFAPKMVTIPFVSSMGKTGWDNMLRRTETLFRNPLELSGSIKACAWEAKAYKKGSGAVSIFFQKLDDFLKEKDINVTLLGHSMGTIVINKAIKLYPGIKYRNIVFMAAADNINNTIDAVGGYMRANRLTDFYNITLHPQADATEIPPNTLGVAPNGSLLEWIDQMFGPNRTRLDRTMGKWWNIKNTLHLFSDDESINRRLHFKVFGFNEGDPTHHGDFTETETTKYPFWDKRFWWIETNCITGR